MARLEPVVLLALAGCGSAATNNHPEHAFARLRIAIESGDARRLYEALELTTQWSVMSIHRAERGMWRLASRFPQGPREVAIARYDAAGRADGPETFFASLGFVERLRTGMGEVRQREALPGGNVVFITVAQGRYVVARGPDGRWGFAGLRDELERRKEHAINALALMQQSAEGYRRSAAGAR